MKKTLFFNRLVLILFLAACTRDVPTVPSHYPPDYIDYTIPQPPDTSASIGFYTEYNFTNLCDYITVKINDKSAFTQRYQRDGTQYCSDDTCAVIKGLMPGSVYDVQVSCDNLLWPLFELTANEICQTVPIKYEDAFPGKSVVSIFCDSYLFRPLPIALIVLVDGKSKGKIEVISKNMVPGDASGVNIDLDYGNHRIEVVDLTNGGIVYNFDGLINEPTMLVKIPL